jgi:hypothetical protein
LLAMVLNVHLVLKDILTINNKRVAVKSILQPPFKGNVK